VESKVPTKARSRFNHKRSRYKSNEKRPRGKRPRKDWEPIQVWAGGFHVKKDLKKEGGVVLLGSGSALATKKGRGGKLGKRELRTIYQNLFEEESQGIKGVTNF